MLTFQERLTLRDNLYWAWYKAKRLYRCGDICFDEAEVARFEANLEQEIDAIIRQFNALRYRMSPIRPVAHPKKSQPDGHLEARQAFSIAVRDQVAWIAFVNVVGPNLDSQMPPWSYGNRLFRSVWFEEGPSGKEILKIGWYRHSSGNLYRKFNQAWPVFRRHIYLTIREMASPKFKLALDESDKRVLDAEETLSNGLRLPYLKHTYWDKPINTVYWASIDLRRFYSSVSVELILQNLVKHSGFPSTQVKKLASHLLTFPLDYSAWSKDELPQLDLDSNPRTFKAIPTGLFVAGFLANVALFETDRLISRRLDGRIAHFRYVDDHITLAKDFNGLVDWLEWYEATVKALPGNMEFNLEKAQPKELASLLKTRQPCTAAGKFPSTLCFLEAKKKSKLDPKFPTPLMTETLGLVSEIARTDFDRLDDRQQRHILNDLEHLLLTEFPDIELREDTRIAFAATMISRLAPRSVPDVEILAKLRRTRRAIKKQIIGLCEPALALKSGPETRSSPTRTKQRLAKQIDQFDDLIKTHQEKFDKATSREQDRVSTLLLKALHEHPEKIRLWTRFLDYCHCVGTKDLSPLREELQLLSRSYPAIAPYLRALVWQVIADHCFACAKAIRSDTATDLSKTRSWNYLQAAARFYTALRTDHPLRFYEETAARLLECALGAVLFLFAHADNDRIFPHREIQALRIACGKAGVPDWESNLATWASKSGQPLSVWLWWAETKASLRPSAEPTPIWLSAAAKLDPRDPLAWSVWARYPRHLPQQVLKHLEHPSSAARRFYLSRKDTGWLYEVLAGLRSKQIVIPPTLRSIASPIRRANLITLDDWVAWTAARAKTKPYDPRVSEWSALQIVHHIALALSDISVVSQNYPIHPANFLLPEDWKAEGQQLITWEYWRTRLGNPRHLRLKRQGLILDSRFCRIVYHGLRLDLEREPIRGLGLLLLGLLRRSFEWPAAWNPSGHQQAWAGLAKALISDVNCSSWTAAIIESCLLPKVRETLLFPRLYAEQATDTRFDPPQIANINELIRALNIAAEVLASYQLSALNHEPRQLVPVCLKQLTRPNWQEDFDIVPLDDIQTH